MKHLLTLFLSIALPAGLFAQIHFTATLSGSQEVPPVVTSATGTGSFTLSDDFTQLKWTISYQGLSGPLSAGGHFHTGRAGTTGGVVKNIASSGGAASATISGTWTRNDASQPLTVALVESLLTGRMYVNFHTTANPSGEIRGQVNLATGIHFTANLNGSQENPPVSTQGTGTGSFILSPDRTQLRWQITYRRLSLSLTAGHFHVADSGRNGPVVKGIANTGDPASNTLSGLWTSTDPVQPLTSALVDSLIAGKIYVNFHTALNPSGEIRGQLKRRGGIGFTANFTGLQENPPVTTTASGTGTFVLNGARNEMTYHITYINLSGPLSAGGHFHAADSGRNGTVVRNIASAGDSSSATVSGVWRSSDGQSLTAALVDSLLTRRIYANFHTAANPSGEIRGQLVLTTGVGFTARLSGAQEVPPVVTNGSGTGSIVLNAARNAIRYDITYLNLSGALSAGGHFHTGRTGTNGPVAKNIASSGAAAAGTVGADWTTSDATQPLTRALVDSLVAKSLYINFHTSANPSGEIRGQVLLANDVVTGVQLTEDQIPESFSLSQNHPNPFNPSTSISYALAANSFVTLKVYDLLGREVATLVNGEMQPGAYTVQWNAEGLASGVYLYRLSAGTGTVISRKMLLLR